MKKFLAIYLGTEAALQRAGWNELDDKERKAREAAGMKAWMEWGEANSAAIVDQGHPLGKTKRAAKLFVNHPHFSIFPGDSVEIMECLPLPAR